MNRQHMIDDDEAHEDYCGATEDEVIESLQEEVADRDATIKRLRAALERIDAHLEVRPGDALENLQVIAWEGNSMGFWLALKAARKTLRERT